MDTERERVLTTGVNVVRIGRLPMVVMEDMVGARPFDLVVVGSVEEIKETDSAVEIRLADIDPSVQAAVREGTALATQTDPGQIAFFDSSDRNG